AARGWPTPGRTCVPRTAAPSRLILRVTGPRTPQSAEGRRVPAPSPVRSRPREPGGRPAGLIAAEHPSNPRRRVSRVKPVRFLVPIVMALAVACGGSGPMGQADAATLDRDTYVSVLVGLPVAARDAADAAGVGRLHPGSLERA